jgi:hypothetical protein
MRLPPALALALTLPALLLASTCGDPCSTPERCAYPTLYALVYDAVSHETLPNATLSQNGVQLPIEVTSEACFTAVCSHAASPPAAGPVTVSMPGYQDAVIDFRPEYGTCGAPMRLVYDVALRSTNDAMPAEVAGPVLVGAGCRK